MELMNLEKTISSRVIAEITGKQHSDIMRDIRVLSDQLGEERAGCKFALGSYTDSNNQQRPQYELTKKESLLLASGYNPILRLKIINRLEELELPRQRTKVEIARSELALLEREEEREKLLLEANNKIELDKHKVVFAESVIGSSNSILVRQFAKDLCGNGFDIGEKRLFNWFRENHYLNSNNEPYQNAISMNLFEVITRSVGSGTNTFTTKTPKVTGNGQVYFAEKIKKSYYPL